MNWIEEIIPIFLDENSERSVKPNLGKVENVLSSGKPRDEILKEVCQILFSDHGNFQYVGIYLVEESKLSLIAWAGERASQRTEIGKDEGLLGVVVSEGKIFNVPDVSKESRYLESFQSTRSEIVIPVKKDNIVVAIIDIGSDFLNAFKGTDEIFLHRIARKMMALF